MTKGVGIDIVQHARINLNIARKILTSNEMEIYDNKINKIEYLASRFAAKEAIIKATNKKYKFLEIEILNSEDGKPFCNISGCSISLSHEKEYSIAICILEDL